MPKGEICAVASLRRNEGSRRTYMHDRPTALYMMESGSKASRAGNRVLMLKAGGWKREKASHHFFFNDKARYWYEI